MADAVALGATAARRAGSSPVPGTKTIGPCMRQHSAGIGQSVRPERRAKLLVPRWFPVTRGRSIGSLAELAGIGGSAEAQLPVLATEFGLLRV